MTKAQSFTLSPCRQKQGRMDWCANLDYLFYGRVHGSLPVFPPLPEELWENRFQTNTNDHTQRPQTGFEPKYEFKQSKLAFHRHAWQNGQTSVWTLTPIKTRLLKGNDSFNLLRLSLRVPSDSHETDEKSNFHWVGLPQVTFTFLLSQSSPHWIIKNGQYPSSNIWRRWVKHQSQK